MDKEIQKIIEEAKAKGYVPERERAQFGRETSWEMEHANGFNSAIDSYNLEEIIKLAYTNELKNI